MIVRRPLDAAEPARHALLVLLLDGPHHGYDLARRFDAHAALGTVMHLGPSHLYALLARLERDGLISGERQESGSRPARRVYHLTEAGRAAAWQWLDEPVARPRDVLLDFPLKLYLAHHVDPQRAAALVERQRVLFTAYLDQLQSARDSANSSARDAADAAFIALMREGRIMRTQAALHWLERCAAL